MTAARPSLFVALPRAPRVKRMHVVDAGQGVIQFRCSCGYDTGWIVDECTVAENRRGLPCPACNPGAEAIASAAEPIHG